MTKSGYKVDNSGDNQGIIVGQNTGTINLSIQNAIKIPSLISTVVQALGIACATEDISSKIGIPKEYKPDEKIEYNCVIRYKYVIKEFATYYSTCESYLNAYDDSNIRGKARILKCVHLWYLDAKGEILAENKDTDKSDIEVIRQNSDRIIDMVKDRIFETVINSKEIDSVYIEDLHLGIACFTCFCFMECKILEKPL